jgi:hypothetical protein
MEIAKLLNPIFGVDLGQIAVLPVSITPQTLILYFLENNAEPAQSEVAISCSAAKKYLLNREFFYLNDNGILHNVSKYGVHRYAFLFRLHLLHDLTKPLTSLCIRYQ